MPVQVDERVLADREQTNRPTHRFPKELSTFRSSAQARSMSYL
jgi:hypothetical protein